MTAVTIAPTFGKNERPSNGLEAICGQLITDQLGRHFVVGVVQFAGSSRPGPNEPEIPRVKFLAIEPLKDDAAEQVSQILDQARKERGLGLVDDIPSVGELTGQAAFDFDGLDDDEREVRLGPDGEHEVPPPSGEEILAERAEAKAAEQPAAEVPAKPRGRKATPATADPFTPGGDT